MSDNWRPYKPAVATEAWKAKKSQSIIEQRQKREAAEAKAAAKAAEKELIAEAKKKADEAQMSLFDL